MQEMDGSKGDSPQEHFYPENLGPFKYTQHFPPSDGEITLKFIMAFDTVIPFFQAWLLSICSLSSSLLMPPPAPPPILTLNLSCYLFFGY